MSLAIIIIPKKTKAIIIELLEICLAKVSTIANPSKKKKAKVPINEIEETKMPNL